LESSYQKIMKFVLFILPLLLPSFLLGAAKQHAYPNVIFVLADDLGIGDVSPTNPECKIKTPHLQKMADEGITFHDAHTSSRSVHPPDTVCSPVGITGGHGLPGECSVVTAII
jgi:hypothetical protein